MKKTLERIDDTVFRSLDKSQELGAVGGITGGPTRILTDFGGRPDVIIDVRIDPNF